MNNFTLAGIGARLIAHIIDNVIIVLIIGLFFGIIVGLASLTGMKGMDGYESIWMLFALPLVCIGLASPIIYESVMLSSPRQATFGKIIMEIKVTDELGNGLTFATALGRTLFKRISLAICGLVCFWPLFNAAEQALHDLAIKTYVVKA